MVKTIARVILSGITATSAMTLFSYLVSDYKRKNFKEPVLLAELSKDKLPLKKGETALPAGWAIHYSIGVAWALAYALIYTRIEPTVKKGFVLGGVSGLMGVSIWDLFFRMHQKPPKIDYRGFYEQLVIAHLVYGVTATISLRGELVMRGAGKRRG